MNHLPVITFLACNTLLVITASTAAARPASSYTVTDLGAVSTAFCLVAINNKGQIAGEENGGAFIWSNGKKVSLERPVRRWQYQVMDINDAGDVVGNQNPGAVAGGKNAYPPMSSSGRVGGW